MGRFVSSRLKHALRSCCTSGRPRRRGHQRRQHREDPQLCRRGGRCRQPQGRVDQLAGKSIEEVMAEGRSKLASMPAGGGAAPAAAGGAAAPAAAEEKKEEAKKEESESEEDDDMGFGLFD